MHPFFVVLQGTEILGLGRPFFILTCSRCRGEYQTEIILLLAAVRTRTLDVHRRTCAIPVDVTAGMNEEEERQCIMDLITDEAHCAIRSVQEGEFEKTHNLYMGKECRLESCDHAVLRRLWCSGFATKGQYDKIGAQSVCPDLQQFMESVVLLPQAKFADTPYSG